jgi:ankyrin repeat protein
MVRLQLPKSYSNMVLTSEVWGNNIRYKHCLKDMLNMLNILKHTYMLLQTALHKAAAVGNYDLVRMLTSATMQLHDDKEVRRLAQDVDMDQNTALLLAVESGSATITEHLLECGSDVNHFNKSRVYPLHSACTNGSLDIVKILVKVLSSKSSPLPSFCLLTGIMISIEKYFQHCYQFNCTIG